ncbi:hypothetical protein HDE_01899 [Halotydeus destructor]|nr:hypothetical protein HDE_01899 [Halotydeus destructor]
MVKGDHLKSAICYLISRPWVLAASVLTVLGFERLANFCAHVGNELPFLQCCPLFSCSKSEAAKKKKDDDENSSKDEQVKQCPFSRLSACFTSCPFAKCSKSPEQSKGEPADQACGCPLTRCWTIFKAHLCPFSCKRQEEPVADNGQLSKCPITRRLETSSCPLVRPLACVAKCVCSPFTTGPMKDMFTRCPFGEGAGRRDSGQDGDAGAEGQADNGQADQSNELDSSDHELVNADELPRD